MLLTLGAHAQRGLQQLLCVCLSVRSISATTSKVSPENDINASSRQDKENKTGDFLKKCSVQKLWRHLLTLSAFGGLVYRALQFILTATEAAIATQKPNGKLNTAC